MNGFAKSCGEAELGRETHFDVADYAIGGRQVLPAHSSDGVASCAKCMPRTAPSASKPELRQNLSPEYLRNTRVREARREAPTTLNSDGFPLIDGWQSPEHNRPPNRLVVTRINHA